MNQSLPDDLPAISSVYLFIGSCYQNSLTTPVCTNSVYCISLLLINMPIDLYLMSTSAPCRAVQLTAAALNLELNLKNTDLFKGENLTPEYIKINPQHTIPTLVDEDGFSIWESRAIITYLVNKYGKGSNLYPQDPKTRAVVDQRLYFDMGTLYYRFADYYYPQIKSNMPADAQKLEKLEDALKFLDQFLEGQKYLAGDHLTLADLSTVATVSTFEVTDDIDFKKYSNINRWYETVKATAPGYKVNEDGVEKMKEMIKQVLEYRKANKM